MQLKILLNNLYIRENTNIKIAILILKIIVFKYANDKRQKTIQILQNTVFDSRVFDLTNIELYNSKQHRLK